MLSVARLGATVQGSCFSLSGWCFPLGVLCQPLEVSNGQPCPKLPCTPWVGALQNKRIVSMLLCRSEASDDGRGVWVTHPCSCSCPVWGALSCRPPHTQTSTHNAPPTAPTGRLPLVPWTALAHLRNLGSGAFGEVALMDWSARGLTVAVKCNGTDCVDGAAIDNERRLYELLLTNPHDHILPVYGICTDAPDGKVRLVMKYSAKGSLSDYLAGTARPEVGGSVEGGWWCVLMSTWSFPPQQTVLSLPPSLCSFFQGGLRLSSVLSILVQAVAGLLHLHSLGILHRDLRAANLLIDATEPLHTRVADFGVSHLLSAFAAGLRATDLTAGKVPTVLRGSAALGPIPVRWSCFLSLCQQ